MKGTEPTTPSLAITAMDLNELTSEAAISVHSAIRQFLAQTGMMLKAWRQRAQIVRTMEQLNALTDVVIDAGFSISAIFSFSLRQVAATKFVAFFSSTPSEKISS